MLKRYILILVITAVIFVGCSNNAINDDRNSSTILTSTHPNTKDFYEFECYWNYAWYNPEFPWNEDNLIAQAVKDRFALNIRWTAPSEDANRKLDHMVANDCYPDCLVINRDVTYMNLIDMNVLLPLDDYIEKYDGVRSVVSEEVMNLSKVNGHIYGIPNWSKKPEDDSGIAGYVINTAIYKQLGSPKLESLDELYNYLALVKNANIVIEGKQVVPLQLKKDVSFVSTGLLWSAYGDQRFGNEIHNYKVRKYGDDLKLTIKDEKFDDFMIYLNKLYQNELLCQQWLIETQTQIEAKLAKGQVAVYASTDVVNQASIANQILQEKNSPYHYDIIEPIAAEGIDQADVYTSFSSVMGWNVVCITKDAKNPERIFEYLDWAISPEGTRVLNYGPKGHYWDGIDANGYPIAIDGVDYTKATQQLPVGQYILPGNTGYIEKSRDALEASTGLTSWEYEARNNVTSNHSIDTTEFENIAPPVGTLEAEIFRFTDYYLKEQMLIMMTVAENEEEVRALLETTIETIEQRGFEDVETYMTQEWHQNLEKMEKQ